MYPPGIDLDHYTTLNKHLYPIHNKKAVTSPRFWPFESGKYTSNCRENYSQLLQGTEVDKYFPVIAGNVPSNCSEYYQACKCFYCIRVWPRLPCIYIVLAFQQKSRTVTYAISLLCIYMENNFIKLLKIVRFMN